MNLTIPRNIINDIHQHGEDSYPEEGAGLLLGTDNLEERFVSAILSLTNSRENGKRHNRYLLTAQDMLNGELAAERLGLSVIGVFHSHPDHPDIPSGFDLEWAMPWFSYFITSVEQGKAIGSRSWRLSDDRTHFKEEMLEFPSANLENKNDKLTKEITY